MRLYIKRYPPENDWNNMIDYAREKGMEEGIEKGREEGLKEGEVAKSFEIAKNLLHLHFPINDIAKATGLTPEQILSLQTVQSILD
jgi:predicted transposase/invertase (TIGR01784 family)